MNRCWKLVALVALTLPGATVSATERPPTATERSIVMLRGLQPERMGVDAAGRLWTLHDNRLTFLAADGDLAGELNVQPNPRSLDADSRWGVASLDAYGRRLTVFSTAGETTTEIDLPDEASDVAWLDPSTVALGLVRADHAVEIRPLREGEVRRLWPVPLPPETGSGFLRSIVLEARPDEKILYALDSVYGELRAFSYSGEEKWQTKIPNPRLEQLESWLRDGNGASGRPLFTVLRLAVATNGSAYVVTDCDPARREAEAWAISPKGKARPLTLSLAEPCCSLDFTLWRDVLIFNHRPPGSPTRCVLERRLP